MDFVSIAMTALSNFLDSSGVNPQDVSLEISDVSEVRPAKPGIKYTFRIKKPVLVHATSNESKTVKTFRYEGAIEGYLTVGSSAGEFFSDAVKDVFNAVCAHLPTCGIAGSPEVSVNEYEVERDMLYAMALFTWEDNT